VSIEKICVPDIGGAENVEVIEICVAIGDEVAIEDSLIVLESDKASMEIPSPAAGIVTAISAVVGDSMAEGDVILSIEGELVGGADSSADIVEVAQAPMIEALASEPEEQSLVGLDFPVGSTDSPSLAVVNETVEIPELGEAENIEVIELCVGVGDVVALGDSLIVLETDKASMEVPSPKAGIITAIAIKEGDIVQQGMPILVLQLAAADNTIINNDREAASQSDAQVGDAGDSQQVPRHQKSSSNILAAASSERVSKGLNTSIYAGPSVRRLSREMGITLETVNGTGPRARITKDDVKAYVKNALKAKAEHSAGLSLPVMPAVDFSKFGDVSVEPLSKIGKLTAVNMQRNWLNIPHVTQFDEADVTDLESFRSSLKAEALNRQLKITPLPFLLKACAAALQEHPKFNASLHADGQSVVFKHYVHIGVAVNTTAGLVVPVVKDVDKKSIWELAQEVDELADKAKNRKLSPQQMQGACFTVSSLGNMGGTGFTPIINGPEVAILGVSKLQTKPVWNGEEFIARKMLPLAVSYDHRVINGVDAGQFFTFLVQGLTDIRRLVL